MVLCNCLDDYEEKIREQRERFEVTAKQGARLYFAVQDLKLLDDMY